MTNKLFNIQLVHLICISYEVGKAKQIEKPTPPPADQWNILRNLILAHSQPSHYPGFTMILNASKYSMP